MTEPRERDEITGIETTGHEWDGIKELNNPLPLWWLWVFYACILGSAIIWVLYPSWPAPTERGFTEGLYPDYDRVSARLDVEGLKLKRAARGAALVDASLQEIEADPALFDFARAQGEAVFGDNCATCHGPGGQGRPGYPSLVDDVWLWGGSIEDIRTTLRHGIRSGDPMARVSQMPAFGRDGILKREEIEDVVTHVLALSGERVDAEAAARGAALFAAQCASCHGPEGRGDRTQGAPNLTDGEWLYGGGRATLRQTVTASRQGVMPAWSGRFDDQTIKALAVYVHSLGGGE